jgi:hypothetical protein
LNVTENSSGPPTVAEVLGRTARELRGDRKVELVARAAKSAGLNWGTGRIADLEAGRVSPTLPTLLQLGIAFSDLLDRPISLADLFAGDGPVALNASTIVELGELRAVLRGQPIGDPAPVRPHLEKIIAETGIDHLFDEDQKSELVLGFRRHTRHTPPGATMLQHPRVREVRRSFLEADYRLIASLRMEVPGDLGGFTRAAVAMEKLWGRSFSDERDRRGGPGANAQKRGRISRELKAELKEAINRGDD